MPNFTLTCEHRTAWDATLDSRVTMEFEKETLTEVIDQFQDFLRGCGYYFDGRLEIVTDEDVEVDDFFGNAKQSARAFDNMANSLMKDYSPQVAAQNETCGLCPVCKLDKNIMQRHQCFDAKCGLR